MTRLAMFCGLALATAATAAAQDRKDVPKELAQFQGKWKVVKAEFGGKRPAGSSQPDLHFTFAGNRVSVQEGTGQSEKGSFAVNAKKGAAQLDLVNTQGTRRQGIYRFEKDGRLSVCFANDKGARPKSFDTKNTAAGMMVLEKVKE